MNELIKLPSLPTMERYDIICISGEKHAIRDNELKEFVSVNCNITYTKALDVAQYCISSDMDKLRDRVELLNTLNNGLS